MEYYRILNLVREPFSNSPEPDFFYASRHHTDCLQKMEVALRLRRGLNVVIGQVGAGKTTLSRQLIRKFSGDPDVRTYLLLDPHFSTEMEFVLSVARLFGLVATGEGDLSEWQLRERIKNFLFEEAVQKNRLIVLIIDEGQKIPDFALESLREFLNYETNEHKLLQIAIFAQEEFKGNLDNNPAFADRVNLVYNLGPLSYRDTRAMVLFRIQQATERGREIPVRYTRPAMHAIYKATGGYPRKIVRICHQILLTLIIQNRNKAGRRVVTAVIRRNQGEYRQPMPRWVKGTALAGLILVVGLAAAFSLREHSFESFGDYPSWGSLKSSILEKTTAVPFFSANADREAGTPIAREYRVIESEIAMSEEQSMEVSVLPPVAKEKPIEAMQAEEASDFARPPFEAMPEAEAEDSSVTGMAGDALPEKSVDDDAETSPATTVEVPDVLGRITITKNQFLWRTLEEIYGVCDDRVLKQFMEANPRIKNLDHVMVGQRVIIPAIPAARPHLYQGGYWIRLAQSTNIGEAHDWYRDYLRQGVPLRLVSSWTEKDGFLFSVVLKDRFSEKEEARKAAMSLPEDLSRGAEIFSGWTEDTWFFGDW